MYDKPLSSQHGLFTVSRTSAFGDEEKPCEEAFAGDIATHYNPQCDHPSKIPIWKHLGEEGAMNKWLSEGTNHRIVNGCIVRDMGVHKAWFVHIENLADLLVFKKRYGSIILRESYNNTDFDHIEIYDHYRE